MGLLSNEDFKALLKKPKVFEEKKKDEDDEAVTKEKQAQRDADRAKDQERRARKKAKSAEWKARMDERKRQEGMYRDRATERQKESNPDYVDLDDSTKQSDDFGAGNNIDNKKISIENSKYLGGDVRFTHLVKGLDFALLQKVKNEQEQVEAKKKKDSAMKQAAKEVERKTKTDIIKSAMAKRISKLLLATPTTQSQDGGVVELFLPRRMAFNFEVDDESMSSSSDVPTTILRSKADCPEPKEMVSGNCDEEVVARIEKLYSYIRQGSNPSKRRKKKSTGNRPISSDFGTKPKVALGEDLDMFGDSASQPTVQSHAPVTTEPAGGNSYFRTQAALPSTVVSKNEAVSSVNKTLAFAETKKKLSEAEERYDSYKSSASAKKLEGAASVFQNAVDPRERKGMGLTAYADLNISMTLGDSDDEDEAPMDTRQFGQNKTGGGDRFNKRDSDRRANSKISKDLNQINQLMAEKKRLRDER